MLGLSLLYALAGQVPVIDALFFGLKSAVLVFVVEAVLRIGRRALKGSIAWTLAVAAFIVPLVRSESPKFGPCSRFLPCTFTRMGLPTQLQKPPHPRSPSRQRPDRSYCFGPHPPSFWTLP